MKNRIKKYSLICAVLLFFAMPVFASELKLNIGDAKIGVGQQFEARLVLDTQNKAVNALEGRIVFSSDILELKEIRDGGSIVNFWIERPVAGTLSATNINTKDHQEVGGTSCLYSCQFVSFSGVTPGGYNGADGEIFSLIFEAKKEGAADIFLENANALLNNGQGTADATTVKNLELKIEKTGNASVPALSDSKPPEDFKPLVGRDRNIFGGKWFLTFATQDKGSGIDYYQVQERWFWKPDNNAWRKIESPYLLKDQGLRSYIYVRAVDKAGNARVTALLPANLPLYQLFIVFGIIIVSALLLKRRPWRKKR